MEYTTLLGSKSQIVIRSKMREALGLTEGDLIQIRSRRKTITIQKVKVVPND